MGLNLSSPTPKAKKGPAPDMNVTPLVDVCLVLLIIFMVVMPQLQNGGQVDMPGVRNPDPKYQQASEPVTLTITATRRFLLEEQPIAHQDAFRLLRKLHATQPDRRLRLKGDRNLDYAVIRDVFARCQEIGFRGIALQVTARDDKRKGES